MSSFKAYLVEALISNELSKYDANIVKSYKAPLRQFLQQYLNNKDIDAAVNFFAALYISENAKPNQIIQDWGLYAAYITANIGNNRNKFLHTSTRHDLELANIAYHRDIKTDKNLRKGPEGHRAVEISQQLEQISKEINLPKNYSPNLWQGWHWVSLGCGSSREEAASGGHCGNAGAKKGDNIFSLRDPANKVLATFIINIRDGKLGEAKGVNNEKLPKEYAPAVVALITSGYVKIWKHGQYLPENDFQPNDIEDPVVRQYVEDHLSNLPQHKHPENYRKLDWIEQWDQNKVDALSPEQKLNFLNEVIKIFQNWTVTQDYEDNLDYDEEKDYDDETNKRYKDIPLPKIDLKFDFDKLVKEVIPLLNKPSTALEMLGRLHDVYAGNKISDSSEIPKKRPDLINAGIPEFKWDSENKPDIKIHDTINIKEKTLDDIAQNLMKQSLKWGSRDRAKFVGQLWDLGERERNETLPDGRISVRSYNVYEKQIAELSDSIFVEAYKKKIYPDYAQDLIANKLRNNDKYTNWYQFTNDQKKIIGQVEICNIKDELRIGLSIEHIEKVIAKLKPALIKMGYSTFLGSANSRYDPAPYDKDVVGNIYICVKEKFNEIVKERVSKKIKILFPNKVNIDKHGSIKYFMDTESTLKSFLEKGVVEEMVHFHNVLGKEYLKISNDLIKNLDKMIMGNAKEIIQCVNHQTTWNNKKGGVVPVERPVVPRHRYEHTFIEFLEQ